MRKIESLEGLRGLCAVLVAFSHLFGPPGAGAAVSLFHLYDLQSIVTVFGPPCVFVFFVLSGFVMAHRYTEPFERGDFWRYLSRRILRLWPILLLATLVAITLAGRPPLPVLLGNLAFLQCILVPPLPQDLPVWSLSYEMFYYLLFGALMLGRWSELVFPAISLAGLVLGVFFNWPVVDILFCASVWYAGFWLARHRLRCPGLFGPVSPARATARIISLLFLAAAYGSASPITTALHKAGVQRALTMGDTLLLPLYFCIVAFALGLQPRRVGWFFSAASVLPLMQILGSLGRPEATAATFFQPTIWLVFCSIVFWITPWPGAWSLGRLEKLGSMSYAIYLLHWPLLSLAWLLFARFGHHPASLGLLLPGAFALLFALSWFAEHRYQTWWVDLHRRFWKARA